MFVEINTSSVKISYLDWSVLIYFKSDGDFNHFGDVTYKGETNYIVKNGKYIDPANKSYVIIEGRYKVVDVIIGLFKEDDSTIISLEYCCSKVSVSSNTKTRIARGGHNIVTTEDEYHDDMAKYQCIGVYDAETKKNCKRLGIGIKSDQAIITISEDINRNIPKNTSTICDLADAILFLKNKQRFIEAVMCSEIKVCGETDEHIHAQMDRMVIPRMILSHTTIRDMSMRGMKEISNQISAKKDQLKELKTR